MTIEILSVEETDFHQHKNDEPHQKQKYNNHKQYYHLLLIERIYPLPVPKTTVPPRTNSIPERK